MRLLTIFTVCFAAVAAGPTPFSGPNRIVGGSVTTINQYPSMSAILFSYGSSVFYQGCGGTILNQRSKLTAAHCLVNPSGVLVPVNQVRSRVGSTNANSGGTVYNTASYIIHPQYNRFTLDNDVAIIRISGSISYNAQRQPVNIASATYNLPDNAVVWATGWGAISHNGPGSEQLRHVQIWTINQNLCAQRYGNAGATITANMLCSGWVDVGGRDQCQGDSGGPLYHNNVQVGVSSWGFNCADRFYPGVNARVSRYTGWIQSNA